MEAGARSAGLITPRERILQEDLGTDRKKRLVVPKGLKEVVCEVLFHGHVVVQKDHQVPRNAPHGEIVSAAKPVILLEADRRDLRIVTGEEADAAIGTAIVGDGDRDPTVLGCGGH